MSLSYFRIAHKNYFGQDIADFSSAARAAIARRSTDGSTPKLSKQVRHEIQKNLAAVESAWTLNNVDFSRIQIAELLKQYATGRSLDFETIGPYLGSYTGQGGMFCEEYLIPEDIIGLKLAVLLRELFPTARLVALCDDYNAGILGKPGYDKTTTFSEEAKATFYDSFYDTLARQGAIPKNAIKEKDYLFVSETSTAADAPYLVEALERRGYIARKGQEIWFVNPVAEQPLHHRFLLRTKTGRWLCEALDATSFLKVENLHLIHLVILPHYMRAQQDKVWEVLRVLGIRPNRYHNIFYNPNSHPDEVVSVIARAFQYAR